MLVKRLLNLSNKFLFLLTFLMFFCSQAMGVESADIWKKETSKEKESIKKEKILEKPKIDLSRENKNLEEIEIVDSDINLEKSIFDFSSIFSSFMFSFSLVVSFFQISADSTPIA